MDWWKEGAGRARLLHDRSIVAEVQPGLRHEVQADGHMALVGDVVVITRSGIRHAIPSRIDFPADYPLREPRAHEVSGLFEHTTARHFYNTPDDLCCLWLDVETPWRRRDPEALRMLLTELAIFYHRQLVYDANPSAGWPGPEQPHGAEAYELYLKTRWRMPDWILRRMSRALAREVYRNARCPCGSRRRYRHCHQQEVLRFLNRAGPNDVEQLVAGLSHLVRAA